MPAIPKELFTMESMLTLSGATGVTFLVSNGIQRAFNFNPRWLGRAVAQALMLFGVYASGGREAADFVVGVVNGFLVFCSSAGATGVAAVRPGVKKEKTRGPGEEKRGFLAPWF